MINFCCKHENDVMLTLQYYKRQNCYDFMIFSLFCSQNILFASCSSGKSTTAGKGKATISKPCATRVRGGASQAKAANPATKL